MSKEDYFNTKIRFEEECEVFKTSYIKSRLQSIRPHWHQSWRSIKNDRKVNENIEKPTHQDYKIYTKVPLKELMLSIESHLNIIISEKVLFHSQNRYPLAKSIFSDRKTCKILKQWEQEKPLLPPQIYFVEERITLANGTHRLNAAFCLGAKTIPIIINWTVQSERLIQDNYKHLFQTTLPKV